MNDKRHTAKPWKNRSAE